jgi:hypothetical protein
VPPVERTTVGSEGRATYTPKARDSSLAPMTAVWPEGARAMGRGALCRPLGSGWILATNLETSISPKNRDLASRL